MRLAHPRSSGRCYFSKRAIGWLTLLSAAWLVNTGCCPKKSQPSPAAVARPVANLVWGKPESNWQMACFPEASAAVIHCYVRNASSSDLPYEKGHLLGYWEHVSLMRLDGMHWIKLDRAVQGLIVGHWTSSGKQVIKPLEIIPPGVFYDNVVLTWTDPRISFRETTFPMKATFLMDLRDFAWPPLLLEETTLNLQVWTTGLRSQTFTVDGRQLKKHLEKANRSSSSAPAGAAMP